MKITGFILIILIIVGIANFFYFSSKRYNCTTEPPSRMEPTDLQKELANLTQENEKLKIRISILENENQHLLAENRTYKHAASSSTAPRLSDGNPTRPERDFSEEVRIQRDAEKSAKEFTEYLRSFRSNSEKEFNSDLTEKFNAEPIDFAWAQDHETKLGQVFATRENLSKFVPEGIICKTTRCQIKIPISSIEESNQVMEGLSQALTESPGLEESRILTLPDISSGFVDFYISRDKDVTLYR